MAKIMFNPKSANTAPLNPVEKSDPNDRPAFNPKAILEQKAAEREAEASLDTKPLGPLKTWSFSGLTEFEGCAYRTYLKKVEGAKEPSGPAAERGSKLHESIENYIQHIVDELDPDVKKHRDLIEELRELYPQGNVHVEGDWGFTREWEITGWTEPDTWARLKLDALHFESETSARIFDWKSGRKFGNELKHAQQLIVYMLGTFKRFPKLEFIYGAMVYIDKGDILEGRYTRADLDMFMPKVHRRATLMTTATDFPPSPSKHNCKWCRLKEPLDGEETARCMWGVTD